MKEQTKNILRYLVLSLKIGLSLYSFIFVDDNILKFGLGTLFLVDGIVFFLKNIKRYTFIKKDNITILEDLKNTKHGK